ncbi:MAG: enoyl-CoA hydratase/isomerase family protein [Deltaproteobacteria bacterium]|nr:enoyl-CoA hydratase/isomerase family protein [Deltaproteobacteria bacterium]
MLNTRRDGNVQIIQLDDGKANALSTAMLTAIGKAIADAKDAGAVLLLGRDKIFSGGLDLREVLTLPAPDFMRFLDLFHATFRALFAYERPMVCAVKGSAVAGGAILLCTGDFRLGARDQGVVGVNEARLGVPFPASAHEIVRTTLDDVSGQRALLFGELFTKDDALKHGFFHTLSDFGDLDALAMERAKDAADISAHAAAGIKAALRGPALARMDADKDRSHKAFVDRWTSPDGQRRLQEAFDKIKVQKEKPKPA